MSVKHLTTGILAHVDAGKTTLSECLLYESGKIRKLGRVDHGDAYLDTDVMEKERGITIFSKQAELAFDDFSLTLLDTPGHADFSPEMERVLQVLDYAVLVISAPDRVTGQVRTLWKLLNHYGVPAIIFVNKMDQPGMDAAEILAELQEQLNSHCVDFSGEAQELQSEEYRECLAVCDDDVLERYLEGTDVTEEDIARMILERKLYPVCFGSALKNQGIDRLVEVIGTYACPPVVTEEFGAKIFKISHDESGARLTWMKITGGVLKVKSVFPSKEEREPEKINQIRVYSGSSFEQVQEIEAGRICAVTGLTGTYAGEAVGAEKESAKALLQPVFTSEVIIPEGEDRSAVIRNLRLLEEEEPMLHVRVDERTGEVNAQIMGQVQTEILRRICRERFGMHLDFGPSRIVYKETIRSAVEGVGHYEPLRHYAEVHLLMEPGEPGSGLEFGSACSTDHLALNWQRLVLTHLEERIHRGVLTGAEITDMKITLIGGRAHEKHTEGGDFRQATYRAVRQGLMSARNVLLEPIYDFRAEIPAENIGRLITDIQRMDGRTDAPGGDGKTAIITGSVPAATLGDYPATVVSYTHGQGHMFCTLKGYEPARDAEEIIKASAYDPDADTEQPSASVFCSHGAGMLVPWDKVREYMHVDTGWTDAEYSESEGSEDEVQAFDGAWKKRKPELSWEEKERARGREEEELQKIFEKTYTGSNWRTPVRSRQNDYSNEPGFWSKDGSLEAAEKAKTGAGTPEGKEEKNAYKKPVKIREKYLLVDGYNMIFSWEELRSLAAVNIDAARDRLIEILANYHGTREGSLILVFDAYKVHGGRGQVYPYNNIFVVFTKEKETADAYIEKTVHKLAANADITVATSDGLEQMIIFGDGARRMSASELAAAVELSAKELREQYLKKDE